VATTELARRCDRCGGYLARDNAFNRCSRCRSVRDEIVKPPVLPRGFWDSAHMRDALATWHMGRVFFAYRTHPQHPRPLSQELIGNWLGLTQVQVGRIEKGRPPEELSKLIAWARILGIPGDLLWFKLPGDDRNGETVSVVTAPTTVDGQSGLLPLEDDAARAGSLDGLLELATPARGNVPFPLRLSQQRSSAVQLMTPGDRLELEQLHAALSDARRYLDNTAVNLFRRQLDRCKADDGDRGAAKALPLVLSILGAISRHAREVKSDVRSQLLSLGADGAEFAGWLYRDLQDSAHATFWYDRAMEWAQEACDTAMQGYVLIKKSQMALEDRDTYRVMTFAEAAHRGPWALPAVIRAEATQQYAFGLAVSGEPIGAVEQHMHEAQETLAEAKADGDTGSTAYFTMDTLLLRQATCYIEAGKPAKAAALFDTVLASGRLSHRDAGFFSARRATALALSGEPDEAAALGLQACRVARETNSGRTMRILADTVQILKPWSGRPGPKSLKQAVLTTSP
jgi:transcriptional regulator with XRE-family HTH domain